MRLPAFIAILPVLVLSIAAARAEDEVLLRFKEFPQASGNLLRLEDLVQVMAGHSESTKRMLKFPLGPGPAAKQTQAWTQSEVMRHLTLRGIHSESIRWTGKEKVNVTSHATVPTQQMAPAFIQDRTVTQAKRIVAQAIKEYVQYKSGEVVDWKIEVEIPIQYVRILQSKRSLTSIGGGKAPWEGEQQFVLDLTDRTEKLQIKVTAKLEMPPMVVVAARPIRREEILNPKALTYRPLQMRTGEQAGDFYTDIQDLVGKQARRSISTGLPLKQDLIGEPVLIKRNAFVQLESIAGPVVVRTQAKSMGSGAEGELIEVQVLDTRQRLFGMVVDSNTVRIAAQSRRTAR